MVGFGFSLGPIVWILIPEILPDVAVGVAVVFNWMSAMLIVLFFPMLPFGHNNFFIFAGFCLIGLIFIGVNVRETKGKTYEEIERLYWEKQEKEDLENTLNRRTETDSLIIHSH
jgi:hypothetical protein